MDKVLFVVSLLFSILLEYGCSEKSTEPGSLITDNRIRVSGKIISEDSDSLLSDIQIKLLGDSIYIDTTDSFGSFEFLIKSEGEFDLLINDSSYIPYNITLYIQKDTSFTINLSLLLIDLYNYFPITMGNSWAYSIFWTQCSSCDFYIEGKLEWKIIDIDTDRINMEEIVDATEIKLLLENDEWILDTTYVNKTDTFYFEIDSDNFLTQQTDNYFSTRTGGRIKFLNTWPIEKDEIVLKNYLWDEPLDGELTILGNVSQTVLKLKKNIGISYWQKINDSNGDSKGNLTLIDYNILE